MKRILQEYVHEVRRNFREITNMYKSTFNRPGLGLIGAGITLSVPLTYSAGVVEAGIETVIRSISKHYSSDLL